MRLGVGPAKTQRIASRYPLPLGGSFGVMNEADQLEILRSKLDSALSWGREELDLSFLGIVGVLESVKFTVLCEMYGLDEDDEDEDEDEEGSF